MENQTEMWQTEVNGQIYETSFEELTQWIAEGSLLPQDKVRRGNLRWLEANKVPALHRFFNAKELGVQPPPIISTTNLQTAEEIPQAQTFNVSQSPPFVAQPLNFTEPPPPQFYQELKPETSLNLCAIHTDAKAEYHCETCTNYFCRACPVQNICPMCGAKCKALEIPFEPQTVFTPQVNQQNAQANPVNEEVKKGANWFYWIAGLSVINSLIMLSGTNWAFAMGLGITQIFDAIADAIVLETGAAGVRYFVFGVDLVICGFFVLLGFFAGKAKKWAFVIGLVIYSLDGLLYLLSFSILGIIIHVLGIYGISKGLSACKK